MMIEGRVLKPDDHIHDLLNPLDESNGFPAAAPAGEKPDHEGIYDLVDVVEKKPKMAFVDTGLRDEIMKRAMEVAERVARELVPGVAERVIREEIEKLKKDA